MPPPSRPRRGARSVAERHEVVRKLWNNGRWDLITALVSPRLVPTQVRRSVLRRTCTHIGAARILGGIAINGPNLRVGDDVFINEGAMFDCNGGISIEDRVAIGPRCTFITSSHLVGPPSMRRRAIKYGAITIGAGSWLATGVTVLPGVRIGSGCIIAAGSVVHHDCEPDGLYAGVPAKRIRDLPR